ncbi:MAG: ABC transporter substrate-binding protein, partial [Treponema sp.]|nr:ABC transporter substrate-binding protein [Treponema sp.]
MKKTCFFIFVMVACMALAPLFAGGKNDNPAPSGSSVPSGQTAAAGSGPTAKLSGRVVVYQPSPAGLADELAAGFEAKTGVKVEQFQGTTGEILARLEAEAANPQADVVILASWADGLGMKSQAVSYIPANSDLMYSSWKDSDNTMFGTSASAVGVIYNTRIFPTLSADWSDLAKPQYKDQLAIPDPEKSGSCKDFLSGYINNKGEAAGWKVWEDLAANGMTVPGANAAALEAVTTGERGILVAGVDYNAYSSMAQGEPLNIYYPAGGTVINPRPAMILKTSPDMANAKAFMDYLLSDEAQKMVADAYLLPGRSDVKCGNRANVSDIPVLTTDWNWMMSNSAAICS